MKQLEKIVTLLLVLLGFSSLAVAQTDTSAVITMTATYYADKFVGRTTSSGEIFTQDKMTCAHKTIPLGTYVEVVNPEGGQRVILKVNDRCPKVGILDMTRTALAALGIKGKGTVNVRLLSAQPDDFVLTPQKGGNADQDAISSSSQPAKKTRRKKKDKATQETTASSSSARQHPKAHNPRIHRGANGERYDLLLSTERSLKNAEARATLVPSTYASLVEFVPVAHGYKIVLHTDLSVGQLQPIIDDLIDAFPRLSTIKAS